VISSIKQHLPHIGHHHHHAQSHHSSSGHSSSEFEPSLLGTQQSTYKPHRTAALVQVERPVIVDTHYPSSSSGKTYVSSDKFPASTVSETKIVKETLVFPEPTSTSSSSKSSRTSASASISDKSSKMGRYDQTINEFEITAGNAHFDEASVSDLPYKTKEYPSYKPHTISSVHSAKATTFTIPCHHIRIGDLVILQHRPYQIIRITTSAQTGQHRYLGVDLFTKQLHEEPCVVSHPSPSVVLHSLLGPVFKQYRLIDIRDDGKLVAMSETGEIKQGLKVVDQGHLWSRLKEAFGRGSGSVRVLVISDHGKELAVDYKIVHLAHKL